MARTQRGASARVLISIRGTMAIAYCVGTLDRPTVEHLLERFRGLAAQGVRGFVCSLERVSHIPFQALDPLLRLQRTVQDDGGKIVFAEASPYLRQVLDFGGLPRHVALALDKHAAVWSLQQPADPPAAQPTAS